MFVGIDVAKDKFDACGIGEKGEKVFSLTAAMDRKGFEKLTFHLKGKRSLLLGLESTACYHIALFSYLTAKGYRVVIINPLLIASFVKLQLRKTKTDKKDAFTIAQFLLLRKEAIENQTFSTDVTSGPRAEKGETYRPGDEAQGQHEEDTLRHLPRTRTDHGGLCQILQLLIRFPSADALKRADVETVAALVVPRSRGRKSRLWVDTLMTTAASSIGVSSPAKELILKQDASLLLEVQKQIAETTKVLMRLCPERMKKDVEILASIKGIGVKTALDFLVEIGGDVALYENDKKLIAAAGLDPSTYQSGKYEGSSKISKRGNRHPRSVIWLMTRGVVFSNDLFRAYFYKRKGEGFCCKMAVLATAHKLIRVMFSMLVHQTCFEQGGR